MENCTRAAPAFDLATNQVQACLGGAGLWRRVFKGYLGELRGAQLSDQPRAPRRFPFPDAPGEGLADFVDDHCLLASCELLEAGLPCGLTIG